MDNYDTAIQFAKDFLTNNILLNDLKKKEKNLTELDITRWDEAIEKAAVDPDTLEFDMLVDLAAETMRDNERLPEFLALFVADVLQGKKTRPTKRGADKYKNWHRDYSLCRAVKEVSKVFDLPLYTNNELSQKTTAAKIVSMATGRNIDIVINAYKKFKHYQG
jgi:hypothetical protein